MRIAAENDNESSGSLDDEQHNPETDEDIKQFQMRRKWETRFTECCIFFKKIELAWMIKKYYFRFYNIYVYHTGMDIFSVEIFYWKK